MSCCGKEIRVLSKFRPSLSALRPIAPIGPAGNPGAIAASIPILNPAPLVGSGTAKREPSLLPPLGNPFQTVSLILCCIYLFIQFSFLHEILILKLNLVLYLPLFFGTLALISFIGSGGVVRSFSFTPVRMFVLFSLMLLLVTPFSAWPGGSLTVLSGFFRTQWILLFYTSGLIFSLTNLKWVLYSTVLAGFLNVITAFFFAKDGESRLELDAIVTIGNSNDLAAQLLMIIPLMWAVFALKQTPFLLRWLSVFLIPLSVYVCLRTGSRGALVAIATGYLITLIYSRGFRRVGIALSLPAVLVLLLAFTPEAVLDRLRTVVRDEDPLSEAAQSRMGRTELMKRALLLTLQHPLTGIGPGQFSTVDGFASRAIGERGFWMQAHNTFLQISSEAGVFTLGVLLATIVACYRAAAQIRKRAIRAANRDYEILSICVMSSLLVFSVAAFFLTLGYRFYYPYLVGLTAALHLAARRDLPESPTQTSRLRRAGPKGMMNASV